MRAITKTGNTLSQKEIEVFSLLFTGLYKSQVADRLCVAPSTIKTHVRNVHRRLHTSNLDEIRRVVANQLCAELVRHD